MASSLLMSTYNRTATAFEYGQGAWLFDTDGNKYLDLLSGIAVSGLGHSHPAVTQAIKNQAGRVIHTSNLYQIPLQAQLAELLTRQSGMDTAFFCNSGAEANEAAIKLARSYGDQNGIENPCIIVMENAFHGRTLATLSASGNRKIQAGFEPLVSGFIRAPYNDLESVRAIATNNSDVVAVMVEPIQGEAGICIPEPDYLSQLRAICDDNDWLLMLDEVQSGNGRTGAYFSYQRSGVLPDVVTTAKGLANGVPIGACLASGKAAKVFKPGAHGSTFGGNPLACAAAIATVTTIVEEQLADRAATLGAQMLDELREQLKFANYVKDIRGAGMMFGIELDEPCSELVMLAMAKGMLINVTAENVIRLLPPLILSDEEAELAVESMARLIKVYAGDDRGPQRRAKARNSSDRRKRTS